VTLLAAAPGAPWGLLIILAAIAAMCWLDSRPRSFFYSRRAFEDDPWLERPELPPGPPLRGELRRPGRELDRW
jgi:hypothetical protein